MLNDILRREKQKDGYVEMSVDETSDDELLLVMLQVIALWTRTKCHIQLFLVPICKNRVVFYSMWTNEEHDEIQLVNK